MISGIKTKLKEATSGHFFRSVFVLAGGTALAQALTILSLPLLTRLYSPQEFGTLAVFLALFSMIGGIAALRYEVAIPIAETDSEAANVLGLALICVLLTTFATLVGVSLFGKEISQLANSPQLQPYLWLLPLTVFASGSYAVFQYWATRKKNFGHIARARLEQAIAGVSLQVFLGWMGVGTQGLVLGHMAKIGAGSFGLARRAMAGSISAFKTITPATMLKVARIYDRYPKYSTFDVLANTAAIQLPIIFIAAISGNAEVGFLALAMQIMQAPLGLLGSSISQVYFAQAVEEHRKGQLGPFTANVLGKLAKIGIGPIIFAGIIAPSVMGFVFGAEWSRTGQLMAWMTPWFALQFLSSPISMSLHVTGRQKTLLALNLTGLALRLLFVYGAVNLMEGNYASEGYAISGAVFYIICLFVFSLYSGITRKIFVSAIFSASPIIAAFVSSGFFIHYFLS